MTDKRKSCMPFDGTLDVWVILFITGGFSCVRNCLNSSHSSGSTCNAQPTAAVYNSWSGDGGVLHSLTSAPHMLLQDASANTRTSF